MLPYQQQYNVMCCSGPLCRNVCLGGVSVCQCVSVYMRMGDSESEGGVEQDTVHCTLTVHVHQAYSGTDRPVYFSLNDTH